MTAVKPRPKPKPKKKAPAPSDSKATGVAQVALREDENVMFKLQIGAETLASLKHTVPNPEPSSSDLKIYDLKSGIGYGDPPWNSINADEKAGESEEEEEEEEDADSEEEVDELIDDSGDDNDNLEVQGGIIFHPLAWS